MRLGKIALGTAAVAWLVASTPALANETPPTPPSPRPGAKPNILVIMTDDVGFAAASAFGGAIPTPTFDRLAARGLVYTNFSTAAVCSATRAALLTGRNQHASGFGTVPEVATRRPGYDSMFPAGTRTFAQVLSDAGYATAMFGKNHNVPTWQSGAEGPFDQWASGLGFSYFYGFHGGLTDQFSPALIENHRFVEPATRGDGTETGYVLDRDLADHAITWLREHRAATEKPFLLYYAPGTAHAPVQAPAEWLARFRGKFDAGWDAYRQSALARQKRAGIVPFITRLAPLPAGVRPWTALSQDEKDLAARYMEAYAAALAYCDEQIGRVIAELENSGQFENTVIIYVQGDNGASGEGGELGAFDYLTRLSGGVSKSAEATHSLANIDNIGGPASYEVGPAGWAAALNTPFPYYKVVASRLGGVRNAMVLSWPAGIAHPGLRPQFSHVTDLAPTLLEIAGLKPPPLDGTSLVPTFASPTTPSKHRTQYYEVFGHAAIYRDGWLLASRLRYEPRRDAVLPDAVAAWELFDLAHDPAGLDDVAGHHPKRVVELERLWASEATRNGVTPLEHSNLAGMLPDARPEPFGAAGRYRLSTAPQRLPDGVFPVINSRDWAVETDVTLASAAHGMVVTQGGRPGGWGLFVQAGEARFVYRANDREDAVFRLATPIKAIRGTHRISLAFKSDGPGIGRGGTFSLSVDGAPAVSGKIDATVPFKFAAEDAAIGFDSGSPVTPDYVLPFRLTGQIDRLEFELGRLMTGHEQKTDALPSPKKD